jgi:transposase
MVDECHLVWGDACGYVWGPTDQRVTLPIENIRERQTYYGGLNLVTGAMILWEASGGNKENTVAFLTYVRQCFQGRRVVVCWDGAPYHTAHLVQEYLVRLQGPDCPEPHRHLQILQFAPYAPAQNPVEDVWLAAKRAVRDAWADLQTFQDVKDVFTHTIMHRVFLSEKLNWYGREDLIRRRREYGFYWE